MDREKLIKGPKEPTPANLNYPVISRLDMPAFAGAHTTLPVLGVEVPEFAKDEKGKTRDFVFIVNESLRNECTEEARQMVYVVDITDEKNPFTVANYQVRGREREFLHARRALRRARLERISICAVTTSASCSSPGSTPACARWTSAILTARRKSATTFPPSPARPTSAASRQRPAQRCKIAIQTNNVEVDNRGYIYAVDRADSGVHILELTGEARRVANFK